jgi:hypothetical protein
MVTLSNVMTAIKKCLQTYIHITYSAETDVCKASVNRMLWREQWKPYIQRLLHALDENGPLRRLRICEGFHVCDGSVSFPDFVI